MRRIVVRRPGGYGRLVLEEGPEPRPGPAEVALDVLSAGVNFADVAVRLGLYASAQELVGWPITPGFEVSGTVAELGDGVARRAVGERVVAVTRFGGYASRIVVPAWQVRAPPAGFDPVEAGGFPAVFLTAWYALHRLARVEAGERVLIHSAAGGVGQALAQLCRAAGARALGVVTGAARVEPALRAGCEAAVDRADADPWPAARRFAPRGFDVVLDANGPSTLRASAAHLAPAGRLVVYGFHAMLPRGRARPSLARLAWGRLRTPRFDPLRLVSANRSIHGFNLSYLFDRADLFARAMDELAALAARGALAPPPTRALPLAEAGEAHRLLQSGQTVGKLVLVP